MKFKNKDQVIVHSLGNGKEYRAKIVGRLGVHHDVGSGFYFIEMIDRFLSVEEYPFDVCMISEWCIKPLY